MPNDQWNEYDDQWEEYEEPSSYAPKDPKRGLTAAIIILSVLVVLLLAGLAFLLLFKPFGIHILPTEPTTAPTTQAVTTEPPTTEPATAAGTRPGVVLASSARGPSLSQKKSIEGMPSSMPM